MKTTRRQTITMPLIPLLLHLFTIIVVTSSFTTPITPRRAAAFTSLRQTPQGVGEPTELPDSLSDSALIAATACSSYAQLAPTPSRCRIDFDTSVGDETYTTLKMSTEFMQKFVTALCYEMIPGLMEERRNEMTAVAEARAALRRLDDDDDDDDDASSQREALQSIIATNGRDPQTTWSGPIARIYFPDEGNAALARRDWTIPSPTGESPVPPCVAFSSLGGVPVSDTSKDTLVFYFCPRAAEASYVEDVLETSETSDNLKLSVFVNPLLVDMGVTGYGMAGRMLRERLIDGLQNVYYLRTLPWGALTRCWPRCFSVWQEDEGVEGGYRLIKNLDALPSNPEVEDIYDVANGIQKERKEGMGILNAFGDFVQGMTQL